MVAVGHAMIGRRLNDLADLGSVFTPQQFGALADGSDDTDALLEAIEEAEAAGGMVLLPPGIYLFETSLPAKSGIAIRGMGRDLCTLRAGPSVTTAMLLGSSGDTVTGFELTGVTLDGRYSVNSVALAGVQVTNGARIRVTNCRMIDMGGVGVLLQGLNAAGGTPHSDVSDNLMDGIGLSDGTTGFGILFKDASTHCRATRNDISNVKGGMGIGGNGASGTGFPTHMTVSHNTIGMQNGTTDMEAIGLTAGCDYAVIANNNIYDSWDNGISYSAAHGSITGNIIDGARNHGIALVGAGTAVVGNKIRNIGKQNDAAYAGIAITGGGRCNVVGNVILDDQGTPTTTHGVKLTTSSGNNLVALNTITGASGTAYTGAISSDLVMDTTSPASPGFQVARLYSDDIRVATSGQAGTTGSDWRSTSRFWVGSNATSSGGQLNVASNAGTTRPTASFNAVASQTQHLWQCLASDLSTVLAQCTVTGRLVGGDGVTSRELGDITGLSSAQVDALFSATPANGTIATGLRSGSAVSLHRRNGSWFYVNMTAV